MPYVKSFDRNQLMLSTWDSLVDEESIARLIDAFVDHLDLTGLDVREVAVEGRPSYNPRSLYKLYIYGNRKGIRSSRKLAESCRVNIEVKWMTGGIEPDFRTISDFRKDNIASLKKIFHEFNQRISGAVEWGFSSVDGSKFHACNSKDRNFTKNKLDDRIKWLDAHVDEYLRILDGMDAQESEEESSDEEFLLTRELIENKLAEAKARLEKYEEYRKIMEETGVSQLSLTDRDSKLMKSRNGFIVAFNPQTAVDSNTHMIRDFNMTNSVTDHGQLFDTVKDISSEETGKVTETVADKGYENADDMLTCLENGIIPHVILDDGKDSVEITADYVESESDAASMDPVELKKSLHSGKIPEAYKDVLKDVEIIEKRVRIPDEPEDAVRSPYGTQEEMINRAKEGYFVRDPERNLVYCPNGEILRQKCIKPNGYIRYANKTACRHCKYRNKCYNGRNEWKEIDFSKDQLEKPCRTWVKAEGREADTAGRQKKGHFELRKLVKFKFFPDRVKLAERMCLSEHPFGTIKRAMGSTYFLLRGLEKVEGEFALFCLGYNLERAKNLLGFRKMMELMVKG